MFMLKEVWCSSESLEIADSELFLAYKGNMTFMYIPVTGTLLPNTRDVFQEHGLTAQNVLSTVTDEESPVNGCTAERQKEVSTKTAERQHDLHTLERDAGKVCTPQSETESIVDGGKVAFTAKNRNYMSSVEDVGTYECDFAGDDNCAKMVFTPESNNYMSTVEDIDTPESQLQDEVNISETGYTADAENEIFSEEDIVTPETAMPNESYSRKQVGTHESNHSRLKTSSRSKQTGKKKQQRQMITLVSI